MRLTIVVPCYNEEAVLPETARRLAELVAGMAEAGTVDADSQILLVDDGSRDGTWGLIEDLAAAQPRIEGLRLAHNRGHQAALLAGLLAADGDAAISIDADLQDDLQAIPEMVAAHQQGAEVVYGVRRRRDTDSWGKRVSAEGYYRLLALLGVEIVFNHADYRLLSRRALEALRAYRESNLFLRGIVAQLGLASAIVYYDRAERYAGESKYPLRRMLAFAWDGVTSFSAAPLRAITGVGSVIALASLGVTVWAIGVRLLTDRAVPGWASTVVPIYFLGGLQLLAIGVIGEYLAKIHIETKRRPRYLIERDTRRDTNSDAGAPRPPTAQLDPSAHGAVLPRRTR